MRNVQATVMLLGAACYLGVLFLVFQPVMSGDILVPASWNLLLVIVAALVIVDSIRKARAGKTRQLATDLLVVKLAAIPFFLINFIVVTWILFFGATLAVFFADAPLEFEGNVVIAAAITFGLSYLAMLTTSTYGWAAIAQLRRDGRIGAPLAMLYRLMLLLFVADVVAGILVDMHARRAEGANAAPNPGSPIVRFVQAGTLLLGAVMYGLVIAFGSELSSYFNFYLIFFIIGAWNTLVLVVTGFVIVDSVRKVRTGQTQALATGTFVVKLAAIPFFLLNFVMLTALALVGSLILLFGGVVLLYAVWIGSGLTILMMLSTSVYAWATIARLRREGVIGTGLTVLYSILSLGFVTDTAAGILLFGHARRRPGLALVIVLLVTGAILSASSLVGGLIQAPSYSGIDDLRSTLDVLSLVGIALIVGTIVIALVRLAFIRRRQRAVAQLPAELPDDEKTPADIVAKV